VGQIGSAFLYSYSAANSCGFGVAFTFIHMLEDCLGKKAKLDIQPMQKGDVKATFANIDVLNEAVGFKSKTNIKEGLQKFVSWYKHYYN